MPLRKGGGIVTQERKKSAFLKERRTGCLRVTEEVSTNISGKTDRDSKIDHSEQGGYCDFPQLWSEGEKNAVGGGKGKNLQKERTGEKKGVHFVEENTKKTTNGKRKRRLRSRVRNQLKQKVHRKAEADGVCSLEAFFTPELQKNEGER